jgi:hypothetical protein
MARGNDAAAALADLRGEFAQAGGSAEDLIASARAAWSQELRHANNIQRDQQDDGSVVPVDLDKVQSQIGDAGTVLDAAKRGPFVIAVVETESGRTYKEALPADEVGFDVHKRDKPRNVPESPQADQGQRDALLGRMSLSTEAKQIEQEAEEAAREARQKVLDSYAERQAKEGAKADREDAKADGGSERKVTVTGTGGSAGTGGSLGTK